MWVPVSKTFVKSPLQSDILFKWWCCLDKHDCYLHKFLLISKTNLARVVHFSPHTCLGRTKNQFTRLFKKICEICCICFKECLHNFLFTSLSSAYFIPTPKLVLLLEGEINCQTFSICMILFHHDLVSSQFCHVFTWKQCSRDSLRFQARAWPSFEIKHCSIRYLNI